MFKGHPKGLYVDFFSNMVERFGFYTMMAILVLFLQAKFGLPADDAGIIYAIFYFSIYALALLGGFIADRTQNYKGTIMVGQIVMFLGYALLFVPGMGLVFTLVGLFTIAFGNGLFKGNLQALVGQMYDNEKYGKLRDSAFSVFYMGINIGAFFAPSAARAIRTWWLTTNGYGYDPDLPSLCHRLIDGKLAETETLQTLADKATLSGQTVTDLTQFAHEYIQVFSTGYNYAFGIAAVAMVISLLIYIGFKKHLPDRRKMVLQDASIIQMPWAQEKKRLIALGLVFLVVIFFWMSFHQNGLTLTLFARDYTDKEVSPFTFIFFYLPALLSLIGIIIGIVMLVRKQMKALMRVVGALLIVAGGFLLWYFYSGFGPENTIEPETFQQFNPILIVFLTPIVVGIFAWQRKRNREPSTPRKIGTGMILAAVGFILMIFASYSLVSPIDLGGNPSPDRVSPYWLMGTYFILTVAELYLSPMGLSFVSKVSPPRFQGLMQGGWLAATALGNALLFVGSSLWVRLEVWQVWSVFVICCLLSAAFIFSIMKRLESATK
ncbi:MAG: peptide MFS transporter [Bacteroidales bacterium]|nr:peptide MFS transporter [Bacteroidales bacterium]